MPDPIRLVDASAPVASIVKERPSTKREEQPKAPKDAVSLSHPNDQRTLKLLQQIFADSLGHRGLSSEAKKSSMPKDTEQVSAFLLEQTNSILIEPYLAMTPGVTADDFSEYVETLSDRLRGGRAEAKSVFKALDLASSDHLDFVEEVWRTLSNGLDRLVSEARLEIQS